MADIHDRLAVVRERIAAAAVRAERDPGEIRLIAVTKGVEPEAIAAAIEAGITDIGESRVQEARRKFAVLGSGGYTRHLIGHLQTNKAAQAAESFDAIHSIDSERIAVALAEQRDPDQGPMAALIEVDLTGIPGRGGVAETGLNDLIRASAGLPGVHLIGLMTMAPPGPPELARETFRRLRELRDRAELATRWDLPELSMGMSGDFEAAVEEGATMVRLGRVLFDDRALPA